jgi:hypothetical protein
MIRPKVCRVIYWTKVSSDTLVSHDEPMYQEIAP